MGKKCSNCKFSDTYETPSFLDGKHVGWRTKMTCTNKKSMRWCREINNLITCSEWEAKENETS